MDLPRTMTAAVTTRHGGPDATEIRTDWPVPTVGAGDVMVRVTAAALNNTDIWSREGAYGTADDADAVVGWKGQPLDFPRIQGIDVAGVVVAVGEAVGPEWIGRRVLVDPTLAYDGDVPDAVMGSEADGGFAEYLVAAADRVHDVSDSPLSDAQLACLPTAYGTALGMINRADCAAGERVLVTGSAGGVGGAAIQLLVDRGCHVIARTSPGKAELVAAGGAHEVSVRGVDEIAAIDEVDVVVDVVGGEVFGELLDRLRTGGRMVTAGAIAGPVVALDVRRLYLRQRRLIGSTMHTPEDFAELARVARSGRIAPRVAEVLPLSELHEAQRRFLAKDFVGKLVVAPSGTGATMSIDDSIAASADTDHVPVTFERCEHVEGPFFHGTRAVLGLGEQLVPGTPSNYHDGRISNHVYFAALLEPAVWAAELATALAASDERGRIYVVEPTGPFEDDPNVTDKKFPGNVTRSYRTRHPMLVVGEVEHWEGHPPEVVQGMLDNIARLREQGLDVIED